MSRATGPRRDPAQNPLAYLASANPLSPLILSPLTLLSRLTVFHRPVFLFAPRLHRTSSHSIQSAAVCHPTHQRLAVPFPCRGFPPLSMRSTQ
jgi:hypothetical protein